MNIDFRCAGIRPFSCLILFLVCLLVPVSTVQAQTLNATFSTATDVPVTANGYSASGTVNFTLNFAPETGTTLTVVNNTGLNFIQGTFSNLSQGQAVTFTYAGVSYNYVANYYGGTGNDLVLVWANNRVISWGSDDEGELGDGILLTNAEVPVAVTTAGTPLAGKTIVSTSAGWHCSIALCADGTMATWGYNGWGQLGNGMPVSNVTQPTAVTTSGVLSGNTIVAVSEGRHFCLALCSDGTVASWGENNVGQLGNGNTTNTTLPVLVNNASGSALFGKTVVQIAAGMEFSVALCSKMGRWPRGVTTSLASLEPVPHHPLVL